MPLDPKNLDIDLIRGELSRRSFKQFIQVFWPVIEPAQRFIDGWHLDCFCDHLVNLRQIRNLLVNCPPSASKSIIFSVFFPAWLWLHEPSARLLYASYALSLSQRDSELCRKVIGSELYQKCYSSIFKINTGVDTKLRFENNRTGFRQAVSVGSATTGFKGNYCVVDDLHNATEADSEQKRENAINWYVDSFYNRLIDFNRDCRVVIGQRIAQRDISNYILENFPDWTHLCLPYEYRPTTYVSPIGWKDPRTTEGEPLWPERFAESEINNLKRKPRTFSAQWNQFPTDSATALFKADQFRYYDETDTAYKTEDRTIDKAKCWRLVTVDLAIATHNKADYTVILVGDIGPDGTLIIVHCVRDRLPGTRIVPTLQAINDQYRPAYFLIEDVAYQRMAIDQGRAEGLAIRGIRPTGDKESRSLPLQVRFENGQVWFPKNRPWLPALERELLEAPNGLYMDQVDALSYLAIEAGKRTRKPKEEQPAAPVKTPEQIFHEALLQGITV